MTIPERSPDLRKDVILSVIILLMALTAGCTITHKFGPFMGKVVDAESGEPIEGAVVLIGFHIKSSSVGGWVYRFADAVEVLTDSQGEFNFPPKRINLFKGMSSWSDKYKLVIFKPGYGAYPGHHQAYSSWKHKQSLLIPENEYITYYLPKLLTLEERKKNLFNIIPPGGTPNEKMPNLHRMKNEEYVYVGID